MHTIGHLSLGVNSFYQCGQGLSYLGAVFSTEKCSMG